MQRYDSYKDSDIQWLGEIPSHWEVCKIKNVSQISSGSTPKSSIERYWGGGIKWITPADFKTDTKYVCKGMRDITEAGALSCSTKLIPKNSVVFSKRAPVGQVSITTDDLCINQGCIACIPNESIITPFFFYLLSCYKDEFESLSGGTTFKEIALNVFADFKISIPPLPEQQAIASYLDTATAKIDEAIAQQQKMIDLLNERKQIIINNAVTKGLNPNAKMKPSGIDWIGNIPEHWGTRAIKFLFNQRNEYNTPIKTSERLSLSIDKGVTLYSEKTTNLDRFKEDVSQYKVAYPNDIILNSMNMIVGAVGLSKYMGCVSPAYYVIYASTKIDVFYYSYLLNIRSIRAVYRVLGRGIYSIDRGDGRVNTCRLKVPYGDFSRIEAPLPPYEEQKQISLYLQSQQKRIDIKIEMCNKQIALLQERKQIIINDVVTGKVKVC